MWQRYESEISPIDNDIWININGESRGLDIMVCEAIDFAEKYMCKANADELYQIKCNFELLAHRIQKWYDHWKNREFSTQQAKGGGE